MRQLLFGQLLFLCCATTLSASYVDGSVSLFPIEYGTFRSVGYATFYNDLNQKDSAALSGEHVVTKVYPTTSTFVAPVTGDGAYSYSFQGPTDPGACYETSLHVIARPTYLPGQYEQTWYGYTQQCDARLRQYHLAIWINLDGNVAPGDGSGYHNVGDVVIITTSAPSGYQFLGWSGDVTSSDTSTSVYMDRDKSVTANWRTPPPPPPPDPITQCEDSSQSGCWSPIVVNLGHGGYELSGPDDPVNFDITATGTPVGLSWTARGGATAFLALDRNGDGVINNGAELFGNYTPLPSGSTAANGFDALTALDANGDGIIDAHDSTWSSLVLWTDLNHDGISQASEIVAIDSSSVTAIGLDYRWTGRRDVSGNTFRYQSHVWMRSDHHGEVRPIYDVFFVPAS